MGYGLGGFSVVTTPGAPEQMPAGSYGERTTALLFLHAVAPLSCVVVHAGWGGAAGTRAVWDPTTGVGWVFYTQQELLMAPATEDYTGELTALVYGAIVD